jgi:hypothetical protein
MAPASATSSAAPAALAAPVSAQPPPPPPRWWRRAPPPWLLCVVLGFGLLWPWQTVLNSLPAIQLLFPASNGLATYCALAFNSPQLPTHLLVLAHGRRSSPGARLRGGFLCLAAVLVALPVGARGLDQESGDDFVFWMCAFAGAATAVVESALFGSCATLGGALAARAAQAVLAGEGVAAVLANAAQLSLQAGASHAAREVLLETSFFSAAAVMLVCALLVVPFFIALLEADAASAMASSSAPSAAGCGSEATAGVPAAASLADAVALVRDLLRACWRTCLAVFANMAILFSLFPGVVASIDYVGTDAGAALLAANGSVAWSLLLFGLFSVSDLCGRMLASLRVCGGPGACGGREGDPDEQLFRSGGGGGGGGGGGKSFAAALGISVGDGGGGGGLLPSDSPLSSPLGSPMRKCSSQALLRNGDDDPLDTDDDRDGPSAAGGSESGSAKANLGVRLSVAALADDGARAYSGSGASVVIAGGGLDGDPGGGGGGGAFGPLASAARRRGWASPLMRRVALLELLTWARLAYVPVFLLASKSQLGPLQDPIVALAMVFLGLSNGHAASLAMVAGPRLARREARDAASVLHVFFRVGGLWVGAVIGTAVEPFFRSQVPIE